MPRWQRMKANVEYRTNTIWGLNRRGGSTKIPGWFVRFGPTEGYVNFEFNTPRWLFYVDWNVWPRTRRFQWSLALPSHHQTAE